MRILTKKTLRTWWEAKPSRKDAIGPLKEWYSIAEKAEWNNPTQIKETIGTASVLKSGRVVFNIAGNKYRMVVQINYKFQAIFIRFIGTHAEYDKINADEV